MKITQKKISIIGILSILMMFLVGCRQSEHDKLLSEGWVVNEHGYEKVEKHSIKSDESKKVLEEIEGFWIDSAAQNFYVVFEKEGIFLEGYEMYQFYPYNEVSFEITQVIRAPDGIKGELAPTSAPMYKFRIDNPGVFVSDGTIDYLSFTVVLENSENPELVTLSFVTKEGYSGGYFTTFERTVGSSIPYEYQYAWGANYSYYIEQQIRDEGMITTGKTDEEIAAEKERIAKKKEKEKREEEQAERERLEIKKQNRREQEKREEERRIEEEKRRKEEQEQQELQAQKEKEAMEAKDIVESHMTSVLENDCTVDFPYSHMSSDKSYWVTPGYDVFGGFSTFIVEEKYINESPSEELIALKAAAQKSSEEIYNTYSDGDNTVIIEDPAIHSILLEYQNGELIYSAIDEARNNN